MPLTKEERDPTNVGIYAIRCRLNGKIYVGSSVNIRKRWNCHRSDLRSGRHHALRLQRAWAKYGEAEFDFELLEIVHDRIFLLAREQFWIWRTKCVDPTFGFNVCAEAGSARGIEWSEKSRERQRANGIRIGISEACRAAQRAVMRGDTARAAQAKAVAARKASGTYAHHDETKLKLRAAHQGKKATEAARANMAAAQRARRAKEADLIHVSI